MKKEIEIEVEHGQWITKTVQIKEENFVMATETAFKIMNELGGNCMGLYLAILKHRNTRTNRCFPSIQLLCKETNLNRKTINSCLGKLASNGYLLINSGYKGTNSNYYFPLEPFFDLFKKDVCQDNAKRRTGKGSSITEKRETKEQKRIHELEEKIARMELENRLKNKNYEEDENDNDILPF